MPNTKDIQRHIKSINNIKKITRAMEVVAATKMRKAVNAVLQTRTYANLSWETVLRLSNGKNNYHLPHPLLESREIKKVCIILITSNRGLCGGFNTNLINKAIRSIERHKDVEHEFILIGKMGKEIYKQHYTVAAEFPKADLATKASDINSISKLIINSYLEKKYDKIVVAYTDFINSNKQIPRVKQILPVNINSEDKYLGAVGKNPKLETTKEYIHEKQEKHVPQEKYGLEYLFEPSPEQVLDQIMPELIKIQLFQAILESNASEHSARMFSMHQATEAATEIVNNLTLSFNKARQAGITAEIAEISAGANVIAD